MRASPSYGLLVFLAAFFSHACLIAIWGNYVPFWDQWDGEALRLYVPWHEGTWRLASLWTAHNEHRPVLSHLQNLALLLGNGRWDPLLQMTVNAIWHGLTAWITWRALLTSSLLSRAALAAWVLLLFCAPFAWQNALWGFQSANYFTLLSGLLVVFGSLRSPTSPRSWMLIAAAGVLLALSSGSALVFPLSALLTLVLIGLARRHAPAEVAVPFILCCVLAVATWWVKAPAPHHQPLIAHSFGQFLQAFACSWAWPNIDLPPLVLVAQMPWILWLAHALIRGQADTPALRVTLACGVIAALQTASIAYARGGGLIDGAPLSRYQEPLVFGALANVLALIQLVRASTPRRKAWQLLAVVWGFVFLTGLVRLTYVNFSIHLPFKAKTDALQRENLQAYLASRDPAILDGKSLWEVSHTDARVVRAVLDSPAMATRLPTELQSNAAPTWIERGTRRLLHISGWLLAATLAGLVWRWRRDRPTPAPTTAAPAGGPAAAP